MAGDTFDGIATAGGWARQGGGSNDGITADGGWDTPTGGCDKIEP